MRPWQTVAFLLALTASACGNLKELSTLSQSLDAQYHGTPSVLRMNSTHLVITFRNLDTLAKLDSASEVAFARDIAAFTKLHYAHPDSIDDIRIAFAAVSKKGIVTVTHIRSPYVFAVSDLH